MMGCGEFQPADDPTDYTALARFCDWVGHWQHDDEKLNKLRTVVQELTNRFGLPDLWRRMLGPGASPRSSAAAASPTER